MARLKQVKQTGILSAVAFGLSLAAQAPQAQRWPTNGGKTAGLRAGSAFR
jgi:hypothetical protein